MHWLFSLSVLSNQAFGQSISVSGSCPGDLFVELSDLTPGGDISLLKGEGTGSEVIEEGRCAGVSTGLTGHEIGLTTRDEDGDGRISLSHTTDPWHCSLSMQVLDEATCTLSEVVSMPDWEYAGAPPTRRSPYRPDMVPVRAGTFLQGCTPGMGDLCEEDESPMAEITLTRSYWMAETEVTAWQFRKVMRYHPTYFPYDYHYREALFPAESLNWHEAASYTNALSALEGLPTCYDCRGDRSEARCRPKDEGPIYDCLGYRLPTEAEWEHAARCGTDFRYPGADDWSDVAHCYCGWGCIYDWGTRPTGMEEPNTCGLYDMSGNVSEFTNDWYDASHYEVRSLTDPEGPSEGEEVVIRGGSESTRCEDTRISARESWDPSSRYYNVGFRVVRTVP